MTPTLVWFRLDLRLDDQPALHAAIRRGGPVLPVFIYDPVSEGPWRPGAANRWWMYQALTHLDGSLIALGSRLILRVGDSLEILQALIAETGATAVYWNRRYEPTVIARDARIKSALRSDAIEVHSFNGSLLFEPWTIQTKTSTPYKVFTPFSRACSDASPPGAALPAPASIPAPSQWPVSLELPDLKLEPTIPWATGMQSAWGDSFAPAGSAADRLLEYTLAEYLTERDRPDHHGTSRLSPHLQIGSISVRRLWHEVRDAVQNHPDGAIRQGGEGFLRQLLWREFAYHLLYHAPESTDAPLRQEFERFPWVSDPAGLAAWQQGRTGYPIVDAGMRQLWQTGWMHNRVRMLVGSFLVKDLRIDWREGARWFWQTLVDADLANNTMGWQWVAGSGADAAPYFRVFNPVVQGERFDPHGDYVRKWVPELSRLPAKRIHHPWDAPAEVLVAAGVALGRDYPSPIIDHDIARREALAAFQSIKSVASGSGPR